MQAIKIVFSIEVFLTERLEILPDNYDKNFLRKYRGFIHHGKEPT